MSNFKIYNASAGSGKTYNITYQFEKKILQSSSPFEFQKIMAITFTNKAVQEMKSRIIDDLKAYKRENINKEFEKKRDKLAEDLKVSKESLRNKADLVLNQILDNYAAYQITTIDSLNHRIVRTFAKDLHYNSGFEIELETDEIFEEAVESILDDVKNNTSIENVIAEYVDYQTEEGKSWNIRPKLVDLAKLLTDEKHNNAIAKISHFNISDFESLKKELKSKLELNRGNVIKLADQFLDLLEQNGLKHTHFKSKYLPNFITKKSHGDMNISTNLPAYLKNIDDENQYKKGENQDVKDIMDSVKPQYTAIVNQLLSEIFDFHLSKKIINQLSQLALLQSIYNESEKIKEDRNCLFINDFNKKINQTIKKQPAPFIYERLGEKIHDFFIDEFQDTSYLQWENLIPLVENTLTSLRDGKKGSLTLVGDVKQAIYEWRGGDPDIFLNLINGVSPFPVSAENHKLEDNFRSHRDIVKFNNGLFQFLSKELSHYGDLESIYADVQQNPRKEKRGYIEIDFNFHKDDYPYAEMVYDKLKKIISHESQNPLFKLNDICVLVRSNKQSKAIAEYLEEKEIAVTTATDLLIHNDISVQLIYNFLRLVFANENQVNSHLILENYIKLNQLNLPLSTYKYLIGLPIDDFIDEFNKQFQTHLDKEKLEYLPLYQKFEYLISALSLSEKSNNYLNAFLEEVFNYSQNMPGSIPAFLSYWEKHKEKLSVSTSVDDNSINLMTIHKSKGLEFGYVIIPWLESTLDDISKTNYWQKLNHVESPIPYSLISKPAKLLFNHPEAKEKIEELSRKSALENLNVFYVACTRASKALFLLSKPEGKSKTDALKMEALLKAFAVAQDSYNEEKALLIQGKWPESESKVQEKSSINAFPLKIRANINQLENRLVLSKNIYDEAKERGNLMHELMAHVYKKTDIKAVDSQLKKSDHFSEEFRQDIKTNIENIINHPDLIMYFSEDWTVHNEKEIAYNKEILRPDRLCLRDNEAVIIDYKTGKESQEHIAQINKYTLALEGLNYKVMKRHIVYINGKIAVKNL